jgi:hypothetical protein
MAARSYRSFDADGCWCGSGVEHSKMKSIIDGMLSTRKSLTGRMCSGLSMFWRPVKKDKGQLRCSRHCRNDYVALYRVQICHRLKDFAYLRQASTDSWIWQACEGKSQNVRKRG